MRYHAPASHPRAPFARTLLSFCVAACCFIIAGCAEMALKQKERQMELVARDWSMTIRASQVVPVYPLTQDLVPGDVFVVQMPIAEQSRRYRERGFLPTDLQAARLQVSDYRAFYRGFEHGPADEDTPLILPRDWRAGPSDGSIAGSILNPSEGDAPNDGFGRVWRSFPRAGFPSYTFEVSNQGGLSAALPVQGIPVALAATGAARATGSITIADAVTYGVDAGDLYEQLHDYVEDARAKGLTPPPGQIWYLRVVTRVFAAKRFDIVLTATSTWGGGVDVGAPKEVGDTKAPEPLAVPERIADTPRAQEIMLDDLELRAAERRAASEDAQAHRTGNSLEGGLTVTDINKRLKALESPDADGAKPVPGAGAAASLAPGVSLRATFASGRTVGFQETYTEPIVVGYHGFDVAIDSSGNIGPIVPTFAVLTEGAFIPPPTGLTTEDTVYRALVNTLRGADPDKSIPVLRVAAGNDDALLVMFESELAKEGNDKNPVGAWTDASHAWIGAAGMGAAPNRRLLVREWLAAALENADF